MSTSEVIHCPNCNEDVPKTLYCLNCGYPLYKLEAEKKTEEETAVEEQETITEAAPEPVVEPEPEIEVDMSVEYEPPTETFMEEEAEDPEAEEPETIVVDDPEPEVEIEVEEATEQVWEPEPMEEPEPEPEVEVEPEPVYEPIVESEPEPEITPEPVQEEPEPVVITKEEREEYMMDEIRMDFAPDPLTKEVMDNLAKNITLKIRLTKLLRENAVKEETFKKLFDSYVDQGRLWVSRRDEIIRRFKADMDRMEEELVSARKDHELLEIRKNIGDASDDEYSVKAPAYKWDIEHLDTEIKNCRGGIQYMVNLQSLVPSEEVSELEALAQTDYSEFDTVEGVTSDTIARMKETLAEALNTLKG